MCWLFSIVQRISFSYDFHIGCAGKKRSFLTGGERGSASMAFRCMHGMFTFSSSVLWTVGGLCALTAIPQQRIG
jgi:hypothetical protein